MNNMHTIARLGRADKPLFVSLIINAFAQDPLFLSLFGQPELSGKHKRRSEAFVEYLFDKSFLLQEEIWGLYTKEGVLGGVYLVEPPSAGNGRLMGGSIRLAIRTARLAFQLPPSTLSFLNRYMVLTRAAIPHKSCHYLIMIGVHPRMQGQGIGKALLQHLLSSVNRHPASWGVSLDTENADNVPLYEKLGFTVSKQEQLGELPIYCMTYESESPRSE